MVFYFGRKSNVMRKDKTRVKKAIDIALEQLDYIIDYEVTTDFVEIIGKKGGDAITYRIYDDGTVYGR